MTMKRIGMLLLLFSFCAFALGKRKEPSTYTIPLPPNPNFSSLDWLVGRWAGQTTGTGLQAVLQLSVRYALEKHIMIFREKISFHATKTLPAREETWMGILSAPRSTPPYILHAYSSTGFLTQYEVTPDRSEIRFNFSGGLHPPAGWLFRRLIERTGDGEFIETVQAAPPGRPFFDYYKARFTRVSPLQPSGGTSVP